MHGASSSPTGPAPRPLRVVQWATGALGRTAIRAVLNRPDLELVGAWVHDPVKAGTDVGTLAGVGPVGIAATGRLEEVLDLAPDCVVYAPADYDDPASQLDNVCALLSAGSNVVATNGFVYPHARGPRLAGELERACERGASSIHGTGVNPGFMSDVLPLVLSRLSRDITHIYTRECSDFSTHPSWRLVHHTVGFGRSECDYLRILRPARAVMRSLFGESLHLVAAGLGLELDEIDATVDHRLAGTELKIASGVIPAGTVAATRWTFNAMADGRPVLTTEVIHKADAARTPEWGEPGYAVRVDGRPPMTLTTGPEWVSNGVAAAAAHAVNAIPTVCRAEPGIRTFLDLPPVTGRPVH
ncbi:hypothetical protein GCM10009678_20010 [Actinomadura kijaniata]|uniref:Dihydrodipicolinate reductase n=1 Tax=Actinomadura namibiensis TaxID=182080 RepID=A0A7W3LIW0_ACTNM|nr:dihydrodipicolinate reductase [Actinomadura namibiensis]MBA8948982.1 hypothetical protein [Actinomadura namibiensis]